MRPNRKPHLVAAGRLWLMRLATLTTFLWPAVACAVVVLPKGTDKPIMGYLVRQDDRTVVVRQEQQGGKGRELSFNKAEIEELIITVSPERLAALDPAHPELYWEYAEELAEKQRDPEARDAAIRLFAITAARGDGRLRNSALLGLVSLARSPEEERLFRAAAYLNDPDHDAAILAAPVTTARTQTAPPSSELLSVLRLARQGKVAAAKALLAKPAVQADAAKIATIIAPDELAEACAGRPLTDAQLRKLLEAELALDDAANSRPAAESKAPSSQSWSQSAKTGQLNPVPAVSLDRLTEFNPAECVFRGGKWVRP
jgi:hypothetical protein